MTDAARTNGSTARIAVVGAGVAGLVAARRLVSHGHDVVLFDKGSRPGGRLATRPADGWTYDHGAQYFTARDPAFVDAVERWCAAGVVAEWQGRIVALEDGRVQPTSGTTRRFVGVPEMNALAANLADGLDVRSRVRIDGVRRNGDRWSLTHSGGDEGPFDALVVNVPAPQAVPLLDEASALRPRVAGIAMDGCWAVLLTFAQPLDVDFDGAFVGGDADRPLAWIARNGSKPGRTRDSWVLHAAPRWTAAHAEATRDAVAEALSHALAAATGRILPATIDRQAHFWRYALPVEPATDGCLADDARRVVACGDWCAGARVEGAWLSGLATAERVATWFGSSPADDQNF